MELIIKFLKYFLLVVTTSLILLALLFLESVLFSSKENSIAYSATFLASIILIFWLYRYLDKQNTGKRSERTLMRRSSAVMHNIKNSLAAEKWSLKMLAEGDFGKVTEEQKAVLEKLFNKNSQMITLLGNLIIEKNGGEIKDAHVNLEEAINDLIYDNSGLISAKKISLEFKNLSYAPPIAIGDAQGIKSALQSVFENAVKYTPEDGNISISLKTNKNEIEVKIQDTGIGIPKDQQDRVFSKFFRASNASEMVSTGTGMGLYIANDLVKANGGKIWFTSEQGEGSAFYISFPRKEF